MRDMLIRLCREEHGAVMAEYALMAAMIAGAAAATVKSFGTDVAALIQKAADAFSSGDGPSNSEVAS